MQPGFGGEEFRVQNEVLFLGLVVSGFSRFGS